MKTGLAQDTTNSAKNLAQQIVKQMADEPLEILKDVKEQTTGEELSGQLDSQRPGDSDEQKKPSERQGQLNDQIKSSRRIEAFQREIEDIRKQNLFKDLQRNISEGGKIPLEDYPELSIDQKQVLNAQTEAVRVKMTNAKNADDKLLVEPAVKKGRQLFNFGKKQSMKNEQTRVEKPVPPSG